ncbi:acyl-CoA N-acyltransferase [Paraphoma chrysanthemicola]|uniref:Acyl-CoA N-acyltransferase n=1 Tax=Paraphoma chrysanthemicola TaxID=798071 RepID=A0A8K0W2Y4_9PLEO|nr:acyl-CoA N-acyltransferase [Paraphoma chrysanthemicola]
MGLVVLPAHVSDISEVYDVYFAAFRENAVTRALFPSASANDMTNSASDFRKVHTSHVNSDSGEIVGMALWDIYLSPSTWTRPQLSWLEGDEKVRAETLITPLWNAREQYWYGERYIYCHVIAVHPSHQRKGVGQKLLNYGISIAQQTKLPIYIESSRDGIRLYEKMGCRRIRRRSRPQARPSTIEHCGKYKVDEAALFVWFPSGEESILPRHIELE